MIVYQASKSQFRTDILNDVVEQKILEQFKLKLKRGVPKAELNSYRQSLRYMDLVIGDAEIPDDCGVALEYNLPQSSKRVDFILTGSGDNNVEHLILVELKQWSTATRSEKDGVVNTFVGGRNRECAHPSYQAWSYSSLLNNFNETVEEENISLVPCAYLHNYLEDDVMTHAHYKDYIEKAPIFLRGEAAQLRDFIKRHVKFGDKKNLLYRIDRGKIRPSKFLADQVASMVKGNDEFVLIDDQKLVLEEALALSAKASDDRKKVLIVSGGPGTGKSVVAVNILSKMMKAGVLTKYVSKNAAPRKVYESKLTKSFKKTVISHLFGSSGEYMNAERNSFGTLVVDEAHRLNNFSGFYGNQGESQVKEIIQAAKCSVFFLDEDQRVTLNDVGTVDEIKKWAAVENAEVVEMELASQFRCNGSDGYLSWLDNVLQIRETANSNLEGIDYDFKVFDSPVDLFNAIYEKNRLNNKSRMVAGYCWDWKSKKDPAAYDVIISEFDFKMRWNLVDDGSLWIIGENSVNEIGCIHTCQGLEVDYIGVIIGEDLIVRNGKVITLPENRSRADKTIFGYKKAMLADPVGTQEKLELIIKNTYRTLMTRGMKGCYVYCVDEETRGYFTSFTSSDK
jgi:uncharacterized protein